MLSADAAKKNKKTSSISSVKPTALGKLVYYLIPLRRKIILNNMDLVFGQSFPPDRIKELAQCFYGHIMKVILENISAAWISEEKRCGRVRVTGHENVIEAAKGNRGILLLTGHFGNWELAPAAAMAHFEMFKGRFHILRRLLANKWFEKIAFGRFYKAGLNVIPKRNSLSLVLDALGRNDVVTFIMDQYANPDKDGILVEFFGKKTGTFKSLALIARQTGAPVIPAVCYREPDGNHIVKFMEPLAWIENQDPDAEIYENTRQYNRALENMLLAHPEQWLWAHKRWKVK